jgi:ATP phosphoribosyltransferase
MRRTSGGYINIALPKGRLGETAFDAFEAAGYGCPSVKAPGRRLVFENAEKKLRYFWVKPTDVAVYVERGAADLGIAGRDILLEYSPDVYELADLKIGVCRVAVAGKKDFRENPGRPLRVATKFPNIALSHYARRGREIDVIALHGSIELAPILGLSDVIVDIVETGKTLAANGLTVLEDVCGISARLIANKAAYKFKNYEISGMVKNIEVKA